jgi:hypothetical protein
MVDSVFPAPSLEEETFQIPSNAETNDTAIETSMLHSNSMLKEYSPPRFEDLFQYTSASKADLGSEQLGNVTPITEDTHTTERFPILLLRASSTKVSMNVSDEDMKSFIDKTLGWEYYRPGIVSEVALIEAEHYSMFSAGTVGYPQTPNIDH